MNLPDLPQIPTIQRDQLKPQHKLLVFDSGAAADSPSLISQLPASELNTPVPFDVVGTITPGIAATGTVTFSGNPTDGQIITISDGENVVTFEFDDDADVEPGNTAVEIGGDGDATATALHTAIGASDLTITSVDDESGLLTLTNDATGSAGNVTITENATNVAVTGMSGGVTATTLPLVILADTSVGAGNKVLVQGFLAVVDGSVAWADATSLLIGDTGTANFATILQAALTDSAKIIPTATNIGADFQDGGATGLGLQLDTDGTEETGSPVTVRVWGIIVAA